MTEDKATEQKSSSTAARTLIIIKVTKTVVLVLTWISLGLAGEIQGPAFKDLKIRTNGSTEDISRALSGRNIGFFISAVVGAMLVDKFTNYWNLIIAIFLDLIAITTITIPWSPNPSVLVVLICVQGLFEGIINIAGQKLIIRIWKEKASSPLHVLHFGYGIGSFIVPNIANPFLAILNSEMTSHNVSINYTVTPNYLSTSSVTKSVANSSETHSKFVRETSVQWAYIIITIIIVINSAIFYWYQIKTSGSGNKIKNISPTTLQLSLNVQQTTKSQLESWTKLINPKTCTGGDRWFGIHIFILLFIYYFNAYGGEALYGKFIRNFSVDRFKFSNDESILLNTSFWISFSLGRFCGFIAAIWIPIRILIILEAFGVLISAVLLNIFAYDSHLMMWVLTQPMGFFIGPMYPSGIAWGNSCLEMTGTGIMVLLFGAGTGGIAYLWIIGHFYDDNIHSFLYLVGAYGIVILLLVVIMNFIVRGRPLRGSQGNKTLNVSVGKQME